MLQRAAKTSIDMRQYTCEVVDGYELMMHLLPAVPAAKKSWYLRAVDAESFETWQWALCSAGAGGGAGGQGSSRASPSSAGDGSSANHADLA